MKKVLLTVVLVIALLVCSFFTYRTFEIENGNKKISTIKNEVVTHLSSKNSSDSNMYDLKVEYHFERKFLGYNPYVIKVIYNDEPNVIYYYDYRNGAIYQGGISPMSGKEDKNFKHIENN